MIIDFGNYRNFVLIVYVIYIALLLEISIVFVGYKARKPESQISYYIGLSFALMCLGCIFNYIFMFYYDYAIFEKLFYIIVDIAIIPPLLSIKSELKHKNLFRNIIIAISLIDVVIFIFSTNLALFLVAFIFSGLRYLFPIGLILYIFYTNFGYIRKRMIMAFIGYDLALIGHLFNQKVILEPIITALGVKIVLPIYSVMLIMMNVGLVLLYFGFNTDIYLETHWKENLMEHYVIYAETNQRIYSRKFMQKDMEKKNEIDIEKDSKKGKAIPFALSNINSYIKSLTEMDKDIKVINQGDVTFLIERGKFLISIFVIKKDLNLLRFLLKETNSEFEKYYSHIINCDFDIEENSCQFESMTPIADRIFKKYEI